MTEIRRFDESDSIEEITSFLHRAYKEHAENGLYFLATHQLPETTAARIAEGTTFVIEMDRRIVGIVTVKLGLSDPYGEYIITRPSASFGQFAVDPEIQRQGLGKKLLAHIEQFARVSGCEELLLDTSQKAEGLIGFYKSQGYDIRARADWRPVVNYESWILGKDLN